MNDIQLMQLRRKAPLFELGSFYAFHYDSGNVYRTDEEGKPWEYPLRKELSGYLWLLKSEENYFKPYTPPGRQTGIPHLVLCRGGVNNPIQHVFNSITRYSLCGNYMLVQWNGEIPKPVTGDERYLMGHHCKVCFKKANLNLY